jgi:hypothetical protein
MDPKTLEAGTIRVRSSPLFDELIEFEVNLSEVPFEKKEGAYSDLGPGIIGRNIIVNWKMFDNF